MFARLWNFTKELPDKVYSLSAIKKGIIDIAQGRKVERNIFRIASTIMTGIFGAYAPDMVSAYNEYLSALINAVLGSDVTKTECNNNDPLSYPTLVKLISVLIISSLGAFLSKHAYRGYTYARHGKTNIENVGLTPKQLSRLAPPNNHIKFTEKVAKQYHEYLVKYLEEQKASGDGASAARVKKVLQQYRKGFAYAAIEFRMTKNLEIGIRDMANRDLEAFIDEQTGELKTESPEGFDSCLIAFTKDFERFLIYERDAPHTDAQPGSTPEFLVRRAGPEPSTSPEQKYSDGGVQPDIIDKDIQAKDKSEKEPSKTPEKEASKPREKEISKTPDEEPSNSYVIKIHPAPEEKKEVEEIVLKPRLSVSISQSSQSKKKSSSSGKTNLHPGQIQFFKQEKERNSRTSSRKEQEISDKQVLSELKLELNSKSTWSWPCFP